MNGRWLLIGALATKVVACGNVERNSGQAQGAGGTPTAVGGSPSAGGVAGAPGAGGLTSGMGGAQSAGGSGGIAGTGGGDEGCACDVLPVECSFTLGNYCAAMTYQCLNRYNGTADLRALCQPQVDYATYSECDDGTVRLDWTEHAENSMHQVFDVETGAATYASAWGFLNTSCDTQEGDTEFVAGEPPGDANCVRCTFCDQGQTHLGEAGAAGAAGEAGSFCSF